MTTLQSKVVAVDPACAAAVQSDRAHLSLHPPNVKNDF